MGVYSHDRRHFAHPSMCMTLAFTLGLSQSYRRTLWMMGGELAGVATVVSTCVFLLAWIQ